MTINLPIAISFSPTPQQAGTYNIEVSAYNDISGPITEVITVTMIENIKGITVSDANTANAGIAKEFQIDVEYHGTASCLSVDFTNDGTIVDFYGDQAMCAQDPNYDIAKWISAIPVVPFTVSNVYDVNGSYKLKITGFNQVSRVEVTHAFVIIDFDCSVPPIKFVDPYPDKDYPKRIYRNKDVTVEAITDLACPIFKNIKRWKITKLDSTTREEIAGTSVYLDDDPYYIDDARKTAIRIPPHVLPYGVYKLTFDMTLDPSGTLGVVVTNSIHLYIEIERAPLIVKLFEGQTSSTIIGYGDTLSLKPGWFSLDPNILPAEDQVSYSAF